MTDLKERIKNASLEELRKIALDEHERAENLFEMVWIPDPEDETVKTPAIGLMHRYRSLLQQMRRDAANEAIKRFVSWVEEHPTAWEHLKILYPDNVNKMRDALGMES